MLKTVIFFILSVCIVVKSNVEVSPQLTRIWGPGLRPHLITLPARYFFIETINTANQSIPLDLGEIFTINIEAISSKLGKPCRIWTNILNRKDGSFIVRYKLYEVCRNFKIAVKYSDRHVAESPYVIKETVYPDDCDCPRTNIKDFMELWNCSLVPQQIIDDLQPFPEINWDEIRPKVIEQFNQPLSISLCHYVVKNNKIYRKCYGKYVGFKMFMDSILLSLARKFQLPDAEFFVNLGDWPLAKHNNNLKYPILSWCGSTDSYDIVMPTYDITESTLENMGRVMLDMLSVQGNVKLNWENRIGKAFWRGRDSNQQRLDLIDIARKYPDLFNVSLTNFFFFRDKQDDYGPTTPHVSFFDFFNYKYQLALDGTVAAYRFPYLLGGGSLIIKQDSKYYEHFYNQLKANVHFVPMKRDLSDLVEKLEWAIKHDDEAKRIAKNGQDFANKHLLPTHIFCYYTQLLYEFSRRITNKIIILDGMEEVEQIKQENHCDCVMRIKEEL